MNQFIASMAAAIAMMIAGVTSGFTDSVMTALSLRSIDDVKELREGKGAPDPASSPCPTPGELTLRTVGDAAVVEAMPRQNFGHSSTLTTGSDADKSRGAGNQRILLAFDFGTIHPFCRVTEATLQLFATSATAGRTIAAYRAVGSWSEASVNWANQPKPAGRPATSTAGDGWQSWDVTDHVNAMIEGPNNGVILRDADENDPIGQVQVAQSRDTAPYEQAPALVVTVG